MSKFFESNYIIYYEDTDSSGFAYHTTYLKLSERARSEMLHNFFPDVVNFLKSNSFFFVVKNLEVNFIKPSYLFDKLNVKTCYVNSTYTSLKLNHLITSDKKKICDISVRLVWISGNTLRPVRLPKNITSRFKAFEIV